jgi:hypothetical protein
MTLADLRPELRRLGVKLGARLVVSAPVGAITPEIRSALQAHKAILLSDVAREMVWADLSTQRWGSAVGDPRPGIVID